MDAWVPTGEKARAVKARYVGVCRDCGAYTQPRNGKGDAYAYCKACHPGATVRLWTRNRVLEAMRAWRARYGRLPSSYDWSRTHARRRGGHALERLSDGDWPSASVVTTLYGTWAEARAAAEHGAATGEPAEVGGDAVPGRPDAAPSSPADPGSQQGIVRALPSTSTT